MPAIELPPLILHPFSDHSAAGTLADGSRAALMLQGVLPRDDRTAGELEERLFTARYCEIRMLFYLGKDLSRWIGQCMERIAREPSLAESGFTEASFATLLVDNPPAPVARKLQAWGVHEHAHIFARSLGLHAVFDKLPPRDFLAGDFLRYYYRFADHLFACRQELSGFRRPQPHEFSFDLYASGEYSKLLEAQWRV